MIKLWVAIQNPFKCKPFKDYGCTTGPISEHKSWEVQFSRYAWNLFEFNLDLNWRGSDHAGPSIELNLFGYTVTAKIYDHRHWDDDTDDWEKYEKA